MRRRARWIFVGLLAGCGNDPAIDVSKVVTGLYKFTASTQTDNCTPRRFVGGRASVAVFPGPESIDLFEADASSEQRYSLKSANGYSVRTPAEGDNLYPCPSVRSGSYVSIRTLIGADHNRIEVNATEEWVITSTCSGARVGVSEVPASSCRADRTLVYELQSECQSPCNIKSNKDPATAEPTYQCDCSRS